MKVITLYMNQDDLDRIKKRVANKEFADRSDAIRFMVKTWLDIREKGLLLSQLSEMIKQKNGNSDIDLGKVFEKVVELANEKSM